MSKEYCYESLRLLLGVVAGNFVPTIVAFAIPHKPEDLSVAAMDKLIVSMQRSKVCCCVLLAACCGHMSYRRWHGVRQHPFILGAAIGSAA